MGPVPDEGEDESVSASVSRRRRLADADGGVEAGVKV